MKSELKSALFTSLRSDMAKNGFSLKAANGRFVRRRGEITEMFQLVCLDAKPGYRIQPNVGIRIEQVENIFHQISGFESKFQKDTPTIGSSVGIYLTGDSRACEFLLESQSEVAVVAERIIGIFQEFALPYFERLGSIQSIDAELNDKPAERTHHRALAFFRCSTGIIVAKLAGRPNYDELASLYADVMTRDNNGFYFKRFEELLTLLKTIEAGSGLQSEARKAH
jgi:hypothetical protein